jgi:hypothetical protein
MNMDKKENENEINTGNGFIDIKSSIIVRLNELFIVQTDEGSVELNVSISADLNEIEPKYHEILLNVLSAKYLNRVSFGDNPFSQSKPIQKQKWYQFWKK